VFYSLEKLPAPKGEEINAANVELEYNK